MEVVLSLQMLPVTEGESGCGNSAVSCESEQSCMSASSCWSYLSAERPGQDEVM